MVEATAPSKRSYGEHKRHLVNLWQSQEERRSKYALLRSIGVNSYQAMRKRDWRLSKIERAYSLTPSTSKSLDHPMLTQSTTE